LKIPRDLSGPTLAKALRVLGYERVRQDGSHIRLTTERGGQHHVTIPNHNPLKVGTLTGILKAVAAHHKLSIEELLAQLSL
jgi:predicted RNA binding protein YcfA (HicA-like mRNA interferase family)